MATWLGGLSSDSTDGLHEKDQPQQRHGFDDAHDHDEDAEAFAGLAHHIGGQRAYFPLKPCGTANRQTTQQTDGQ